jgi:transposase
MARNTGACFSPKRIIELTPSALQGMLPEAEHVLAVTSSLAVVHCLRQQIKTLAKTVPQHLTPTSAYVQRQTVDGIGTILAQTIVLETGDIGRFPSVGHYASYCRCVGSTKVSNSKRKGQGNVNNGDLYLDRAYTEATQFATGMRLRPQVGGVCQAGHHGKKLSKVV